MLLFSKQHYKAGFSIWGMIVTTCTVCRGFLQRKGRNAYGREGNEGEDILKEFLIERRTEVLKMMTLDYTFERRLMLQQEEAREAVREAAEKAHADGQEDKLWSLIQKKQLKGKTNAQIADELETTEEEITEIIKKRQ